MTGSVYIYVFTYMCMYICVYAEELMSKWAAAVQAGVWSREQRGDQ